MIMNEASKDLGLNVIQSWCLVRNTPPNSGDVLARDNRYWNLLLLLFQSVNIVTNGMTCYLKPLIKDHHKLFKSLFSQKRLIPKHHFMVHYPLCIRKIGPLLYICRMRFEAKHIFLRDL